MTDTYTIEQFRSSRGCCSYVVNDMHTKAAILIDPSEEVPKEMYYDYLNENHLKLSFIVETHTHADHISSGKMFKEETGAKILQHKNAASSYKDKEISEDTLMLGDTKIQFLETPGHTDDSICILVGDVIFTGDTLLIRDVGRTDFQNGSSKELHNSLWTKIMSLPDDTMVLPAHAYDNDRYSTIWEERVRNPALLLGRTDFIAAVDAKRLLKPDLFDIALAKNSE